MIIVLETYEKEISETLCQSTSINPETHLLLPICNSEYLIRRLVSGSSIHIGPLGDVPLRRIVKASELREFGLRPQSLEGPTSSWCCTEV